MQTLRSVHKYHGGPSLAQHRDSHGSPFPLPSPKILLVIIGPAGSGKSTVASHVAKHFDLSFIEGDDYHSSGNKTKMARGVPLKDEDRRSWLMTLCNEVKHQLQQSSTVAVVVTCSALKHAYRDVFRAAFADKGFLRLSFIYLRVDCDSLQARVGARIGHYMKDRMVHSQLEILEEPAPDEVDVMTISGGAPQEEVSYQAISRMQQLLPTQQLASTH